MFFVACEPHEGVLLGQLHARRFLGGLVALADVCVVFLYWHLFVAARAELIVLVACFGAQVEQVRVVLYI